MPYTSAKGFSVPATGTLAGTWGSDGTTPTANSSNALNQGVTQLLDQLLGGTTTLSLSSSTPVLLTQLQTQNGMLRITGTLLANIVISPDSGVLWTGLYSWENVTSGSFSVTITNSAGSVVLPQSRRGLLWIDTTNGPRIIAISGSSGADPIPSGTNMLLYVSAAPAGWSATGLNDLAIQAVSSGAGTTYGSVAYSVLFGRTQTDGHTLTLAEIPSHDHAYNQNSATVTAGTGSSTAYANSQVQALTTPSGGGGAHTHGIDMRVTTATVLICTKN